MFYVICTLSRTRMEMGCEPLVHTAATVFKDLCYENRDNITAGIIVGGWDRLKGGQVRPSVLCIRFISQTETTSSSVGGTD